MSNLKLQYFPVGGQAEAARMAFLIRGIEFITFPKWWQMKKDQDMPMLTISDAKSGKQIDHVGQSNFVVRYAGSCPVNSGSSNTNTDESN